MERMKKRWENNELVCINRRPARTSFHHYSSIGEAMKYDTYRKNWQDNSFDMNKNRMSLNGQWRFLYLEAPEYSPENFSQVEILRGVTGTNWPFHLAGRRRDTARCIIRMYGISFRLIRLSYRRTIQPVFTEGRFILTGTGWTAIS